MCEVENCFFSQTGTCRDSSELSNIALKRDASRQAAKAGLHETSEGIEESFNIVVEEKLQEGCEFVTTLFTEAIRRIKTQDLKGLGSPNS